MVVVGAGTAGAVVVVVPGGATVEGTLAAVVEGGDVVAVVEPGDDTVAIGGARPEPGWVVGITGPGSAPPVVGPLGTRPRVGAPGARDSGCADPVGPPGVATVWRAGADRAATSAIRASDTASTPHQ
ncbi:MAG: hypothetical protein ACLP9C_02750 [Acidimicrobiales bacterium]